MKKLVCPKCGSIEKFTAHQLVRMDVYVDSDGEFLDNLEGGVDAAIYDSETPYGPYTCCKCGEEFDVD